jgi:hypothetical protein
MQTILKGSRYERTMDESNVRLQVTMDRMWNRLLRYPRSENTDLGHPAELAEPQKTRQQVSALCA